MLVVCPAFYLSSYGLPRDLQGQFRSNVLLNSTVSCELVAISFPQNVHRPKTASIMPCGNGIQCFLALSHQWGCFGSLNGFQSHLTVRANTNIFLWPSICLNFLSTGQDSIYLGLETVAYFPREVLSLHPQDSSPGSCILDPSVYKPINCRKSPRSSGSLISSQQSNPIFGLIHWVAKCSVSYCYCRWYVLLPFCFKS